MSKVNGKVSDSVKKQLCGIVNQKFEMKKKKRDAENSDIMDVALEHAKKKLGYAVIKKQIDNNQKKIDSIKSDIAMLYQKLSDMGFDSDGRLRTLYDRKTGQYLPMASIANKMITGRITESRADLEKERIDFTYKIMLAEDATEAKKIMESIKI